MRLEDVAALYMEEKARRLRASTLEGYESALRLHVLPRFGGAELSELTFEEVQAWVDSLPLPGQAGKAYKTLRQVVRWAIRRERPRQLPRVGGRHGLGPTFR